MMSKLLCGTYLLLLSCFLAHMPTQINGNVAEFLERQRQLAEEQWNSNDEGLKYEEDDEAEGGAVTDATAGSDYAYVYVDENGDYYEAEGEEDDEEEEEEDVPVFIPKKKKSKGYKKYAGRSLRKCNAFDIDDVILEVQALVKCPIYNESSMMKLRDDHQLNLRMIKKITQETRKGSEPTLQVDPTQPNQKKPVKIPTVEALKDLEIGARVMARYQGKTKYVHGVIKDKHKGAKDVISYEIKYDNGSEEARVGRNLIIPLESEQEKAKNDAKNENKKGVGRRDLKLSFKELQEERRRRKEEQMQALLLEEKDPGRVLETNCEAQVCMACKLVVDEFASRVHKNIDNADVEYLYDLVEYKQPFCDSPEIVQRYTPVVKNICEKILDEDSGNRDFFIRPFEEDTDWAKVRSAETLLPKKEHICINTGMCDPVAFEFEIMPDQEWGSDQCFVCHALLDDLEDKTSLQVKVTEGSAIGLAKSGCENLKLPDALAAECKIMTEGKSLDDIGWILKLFKERQERKDKVHRNFADSACEELGACEKWVDPTAEVEPVIEAVFS